MATVIMQKWDGITPDQYDALRESVGWDRDVPAGMRFHVASFGDGVLRMTDVWDSEELFGTFVQTRILLQRLDARANGPRSCVTCTRIRSSARLGVRRQEQWPWSSFRSYFCGERGRVRINDCSVLQMTVRAKAA